MTDFDAVTLSYDAQARAARALSGESERAERLGRLYLQAFNRMMRRYDAETFLFTQARNLASSLHNALVWNHSGRMVLRAITDAELFATFSAEVTR